MKRRKRSASPRVGRILWNRRPDGSDLGDIDEVVLHDVVTVHIEQMDTRCWWIGIYLGDDRYWMGNFVADSRGRMSFVEHDNEGIEWDSDNEHAAVVGP